MLSEPMCIECYERNPKNTKKSIIIVMDAKRKKIQEYTV